MLGFCLMISFLCFLTSVKGAIVGNPIAHPKTIEDPIITKFREYLRIKSAHPDPDYDGCISWLKNQAKDIGLEFNIVNFEPPNLFAVWMTWRGSNPNLKSIMINSHMDVVAADPSKWDHDPFEAYKDENGNIYGRGALDMKSATVATLEAIRRLKDSGFKPLRTIHVTVVPDEERGGLKGMQPFVNSPEYSRLNIGFDWDESSGSRTNQISVINDEKSTWRFNFTAVGKSSHSSSMPEITAMGKLQIVINELLKFRTSQLKLILKKHKSLEEVTSLNLVRLGGGLGDNTIPNEVWASFDMRIRLKPGWTFREVEKMLNDTAAKAGASYSFILKSTETGVTPADNSSIWWTSLQKSCAQLNARCASEILSAQTDGRYVRNLGIPAFGLNPIYLKYTSKGSGPHQDNEQLNEKDLLNSIDRYALFIRNFAELS